MYPLPSPIRAKFGMWQCTHGVLNDAKFYLIDIHLKGSCADPHDLIPCWATAWLCSLYADADDSEIWHGRVSWNAFIVLLEFHNGWADRKTYTHTSRDEFAGSGWMHACIRTFALFTPESIDWSLPNFQQISGLYKSIFKLRLLNRGTFLRQPICRACWPKLTHTHTLHSSFSLLKFDNCWDLGASRHGLLR